MSTTEERLARLEEGYAHVATQAGLESVRGELKELRGELKADIVAVRGELKDIRGELKADNEVLRGEMKAMAGSFRVWIIIAAIIQAGFGALLSLAPWAS
ncbi:MAG: hypothetical protein OXF32_07615 [Anaerolineaceae bacterium]|nr:hypothetical protein [Anaerolineaceae bacterium]